MIDIPNRHLQEIKYLYKNFKIELQIGKGKSLIDYLAGVKQRDNFAPTMFIIIMHFLSELLEKKFKENNISILSFFHNSNLNNKCCKLIRHDTTSTKGWRWRHLTLVVLLLKANYFYFYMLMMKI